jgi:orotate phosphoribosyltransferase
MENFRQAFIGFAVRKGVIRFGGFKTKAGRHSPYFFNAGLFNDGESLRELSQFYAKALLAANLGFDMLFGPAYKGIPLVAGVAIALAETGTNVPFCFNRKEAKDHGEGGATVGAPLQGRVVIIDDVISAGTSVRESVVTIRSQGATPAAVLISLDRMERGEGALTATQEVSATYGIPVVSIATLDDLLDYLRSQADLSGQLDQVLQYRALYGGDAAA